MKKRVARPVTVAIAYIRASKEEQQLSPEAQRAAIEAWAAREGVQVAAWHVDQGVGGASPIEKRKALLEALGSLRDHKAGALVVAKRDRLARDPIIAAMVERLVSDSSARVISAAGEGNDVDDPSSVLMRRIVDAFAEYERLLISTRTRKALAVKKARGELTGQAPFGYKAVDGKLVVDEGEQATIAAAKELRAGGLSVRSIATELEIRGVVGRTGKPLSHTQVHRFFT